MRAHDRTGVGAGSAEWRTPPDLFARLDRRYQFGYDAFATHENALCDMYSTIEGTFDRQSYTCGEVTSWPESGLTYPWQDLRVFMNPPYSRALIEKCIEKAWNERENAALIVALIPAATETNWFQRYILPYCHIDWLPKRVRCIDPETGLPGASPPSGGVIALFKTDLQ